ncbi:MAG: flavodoxin [Selenomonadaceae bacterium]|nr:flavodoxin [Selenomonadaceae bacterium]
MSKIAVVYWSGTGNTEAMANAIVEGAKDAGGEVELFQVDDFKADDIANYDGVIFGCPAMGDEVLEEDSFEPFFAEAEAKLEGVPVALFGSYGWGGGAWMEAWIERTKGTGAKLFKEEGLIAENAPDDDVLTECKALGADFVKSF